MDLQFGTKMKRLEESEKKKRDGSSEIHTDHASTTLESHLLSCAEELLPLEALYCYFNFGKTSALQLAFLRDSEKDDVILVPWSLQCLLEECVYRI